MLRIQMEKRNTTRLQDAPSQPSPCHGLDSQQWKRPLPFKLEPSGFVWHTFFLIFLLSLNMMLLTLLDAVCGLLAFVVESSVVIQQFCRWWHGGLQVSGSAQHHATVHTVVCGVGEQMCTLLLSVYLGAGLLSLKVAAEQPW